MKTYDLPQIAAAIGAFAILSACGSQTAVAPLSANEKPLTAMHVGPLPTYSTIVPNRHANGKDYEFVLNDYGSYISVFNYPKSDQQVGTINGVGGQGCTNVPYGYGNKTFWVVAGNTQIEEFTISGKLLRTLSVPYSFPTSCAMNTAGDLAVGIYYQSSGGGDIIIFKHARGTGKVYHTPLDEEFFDGYDPKGDLFADGFTGDRSGFALVELPKGSSTFVTIKTSNTVNFPGSVQWDGTYLTVFDQETNEFYQYTVSGTTAQLKGTVQLSGSSDCAQTWIVKGLVYCGDAGNGDGEVFRYPAGGSVIAALQGTFDLPLGITAAKK